MMNCFWRYETSDGQTRQEEGKLVTDAEGKQYMKVHGSFSYIGPDGNTYYGSYEADKDGYQFTPTEPSVGIPNSALLSLVGWCDEMDRGIIQFRHKYE